MYGFVVPLQCAHLLQVEVADLTARLLSTQQQVCVGWIVKLIPLAPSIHIIISGGINLLVDVHINNYRCRFGSCMRKQTKHLNYQTVCVQEVNFLFQCTLHYT